MWWCWTASLRPRLRGRIRSGSSRPPMAHPIPVRETKSRRAPGEVERGNAAGSGPAHAGRDSGIRRSLRPGAGRYGCGRIRGRSPGAVAREVNGAKLAVLGFHPGRASMKYQTRHAAVDREHSEVDGAGRVPQPRSAGGHGGHGQRSRRRRTPIRPPSACVDENQRPLPFTISRRVSSSFQERRARCSVLARRPRDRVLADASRRRRSGVASARRCSPRHSSRRGIGVAAAGLYGRGWPRSAAWDCCLIGCSTAAAACSA